MNKPSSYLNKTDFVPRADTDSHKDEILELRKPSDCKTKIGETCVRGAAPGFMPCRVRAAEPDDFKHPEGTYVVITGSLISGLKLWGTFTTVEEAVQWAEERPLLGSATVMPVQAKEYRELTECEDILKRAGGS